MRQLEELRKTVTSDEIARAREALKPKPKKAGVRGQGSGVREAVGAEAQA
jgi:hypothetical protein